MTFEQWCERRGIVQVEGPMMKALREAWGLVRLASKRRLGVPKSLMEAYEAFLNPDGDISVEEEYGVGPTHYAKGPLEGRVEALERIVEEWA